MDPTYILQRIMSSDHSKLPVSQVRARTRVFQGEETTLDTHTSLELPTVNAGKPSHILWRRLTTAILLLFLSTVLAGLILEDKLHATLRHPNTDPAYNETGDHVPQSLFTVGGSSRALGAELQGSGPIRIANRYPLIDRSILAKLGEPDVDGRSDEQWPPTITRIPEGRPAATQKWTSTQVQPDIPCGPSRSRPCHFLFPLRMAEQESKARIHFLQVVKLAKRLNRILVLPNVAKSRMGACYKYPFEAYYDVSSLGGADFVTLDEFRVWSSQQNKIHAQLVSVAGSTPELIAEMGEEVVVASTGLVMHPFPTELAEETEFPGCFLSKYAAQLDMHHTSISIALDAQNPGPNVDFGDILTNTLQEERGGSDDVLVLNWDLRRPIFPPCEGDRPLRYSTRLQALAKTLIPATPYLAIHWRMETMSPDVLEDCAHALIDVLSNTLHDTAHLGRDISHVWFASDYPYPIADAPPSRPAGKVAKSGTFKTFGAQHEAAVELLRAAFRVGGELDRWSLVDITGSLQDLDNSEQPELLQDAGVLGILDKMIVTQADLFVSGSRRCSRQSSFTRQVTESRQVNWMEARNVVTLF